jgi:hypothetical protein
MDSWSTHQWVTSDHRHLNIRGQWVRQHFCVACERDFVELVESGQRHAVYTSAFDFERLPDEVSARWLREPCPGKPTESDEQDRKMRQGPSMGRLAPTLPRRLIRRTGSEPSP